MAERRLGLMLHKLVVLGLSNHAEPYFLVLWSITAKEKRLFQDSKELKLT